MNDDRVDVRDFPRSATDWRVQDKGAAWWRATADHWENLANSAEVDGDEQHAQRHREEAARCRDVARRKELYADLNASLKPDGEKD